MNAHDYRHNPAVNEEWISCAKCSGWMVPLAKYEVESAGYGIPDFDDFVRDTFWLFGLVHFLALAAFGLLAVIYEEIVTAVRRRKVEKLKREILPRYPDSQICPQCFQIKKLP